MLVGGVALLSLFSMVLPAALPGILDMAPASAGGDPVIAAAGDIACDPTNSQFNGGNGTASNCRARYTSDLLVNGSFAGVLALGDNQYYCGGYSAFTKSYALGWGRVKSATHPVVGNHEYLTSGGTGCNDTNTGAAGYFKYFGGSAGQAGKGWYSFDIGAWHLVALNSNCSNAGGCSKGSPQYTDSGYAFRRSAGLTASQVRRLSGPPAGDRRPHPKAILATQRGPRAVPRRDTGPRSRAHLRMVLQPDQQPVNSPSTLALSRLRFPLPSPISLGIWAAPESRGTTSSPFPFFQADRGGALTD